MGGADLGLVAYATRRQRDEAWEAWRRTPLTSEEVETIMSRPNGPYVILEMVRYGKIEAEPAVEAIDRWESRRRREAWRRLWRSLTGRDADST